MQDRCGKVNLPQRLFSCDQNRTDGAHISVSGKAGQVLEKPGKMRS